MFSLEELEVLLRGQLKQWEKEEENDIDILGDSESYFNGANEAIFRIMDELGIPY